MKRRGLVLLAILAAPVMAKGAAAPQLELPPFPLPALVHDGGMTVEMTPTRLLRELHRAGLHGLDDLETADADYGVLRRDSLNVLAAWLESACRSVGFTLSNARQHPYDGTALARLLTMATGLAGLHNDGLPLAMPIGTIVCERHAAWGELPGDGAKDAYVIFATEQGIMIYDPPTRQLINLAEFPNRKRILRIRF